jgi:multidrug efflux pump subunit AcrA (membrane-fusion protein)
MKTTKRKIQAVLTIIFLALVVCQEKFEIRQVGRGRNLGGEVELVSGVKPGETVVVDGAFLLKAEADKSRGEGEEHEH